MIMIIMMPVTRLLSNHDGGTGTQASTHAAAGAALALALRQAAAACQRLPGRRLPGQPRASGLPAGGRLRLGLQLEINAGLRIPPAPGFGPDRRAESIGCLHFVISRRREHCDGHSHGDESLASLSPG